MSARPGLRGACAAAFACLAIAGCGSDDSSSADTPLAAAIPDDAGIVFRATLRPSDEQSDAIQSIASRVAGVDLGQLVQTELDSAFSEAEPSVDYSEQIEPWLGDHALFWSTTSDLAQDTPAWTLLFETSDPGKAEDLLEDVSTGTGEYDGVTYYLGDDDSMRVAIVDDLLVGGTTESFEHAIDTLHGGPTLDDDELSEQLDGDSLASMWLDLKTAISVSGDTDQASLDAFNTLVPGLLSQPMTASLDVSDSDVSVDVGLGSAGALAAGTEESSVLAELPADSSYAGGIQDLGDSYANLVELGTQLGGESGSQYQQIQDQAELATGVPLTDSLKSLGDAAFFFRGDSKLSLEGGLLVEVRDADTLRKTLDGVVNAAEQAGLPMVPPPSSLDADLAFTIPPGRRGGLPVPITIALSGDRFAVASTSAIKDLLEPIDTLEMAEYYDEAREAVGDLPLGTYVDLPSVGTLLRSFAADEPQLAQVADYLDKLTFVAAGTSSDDERTNARIVVGVGD